MSFEVVIENLRAAADTLRTTTDPMADYELGVTKLDADAMGHIELAGWLEAVVEQCDNAGQAFRDGAVTLAETLAATAADFERTDEQQAQQYTFPSLLPLPGSTPTPPVYGPPAPSTTPTPTTGGTP